MQEEEGQWGKEGEGSRQGTCIKDLWTKTSGGEGLNVGRGGGAGDSNGGKWGLLYLNNNKKKKTMKSYFFVFLPVGNISIFC